MQAFDTTPELTGSLDDVEIPDEFNLLGVLDLARQIMGLTWDYLKSKITDLIGEENMQRLLWIKDQIRTFIDEGWSGFFDQIKDRLSGLRDELFDQIREFVVVRVLQRAVTRLASMLSPVGAVIQNSLRERIDNAIDALIERIRGLFTGDDDGEEPQEAEEPEDIDEIFEHRQRIETTDGVHHLWIERTSSGPIPMVASEERPVSGTTAQVQQMEMTEEQQVSMEQATDDISTQTQQLEQEVQRLVNEAETGEALQIEPEPVFQIKDRMAESLIEILEQLDSGERAEHLLGHLRVHEQTADDVEPGLESGLTDGEPPPARVRLPATLVYVFEARPTLKPVFDARSAVGKALVSDLATISVTDSAADIQFTKQFEKNNDKTAYYTLLRTELRDGQHESDIRHPLLTDVVLATPSVGIPTRVQGNIETWLDNAEVEELPQSVRSEILKIIEDAQLTTREDKSSDRVDVVIDSGDRKQIAETLEAAKQLSENPAMFDRWEELLFEPEWHHAWPKEYGGREDQPELYLPRLLHNFAGTDEYAGGFHQRLNEEVRKQGTVFRKHGFVPLPSAREYRRRLGDLFPSEREEIHEKLKDLLFKVYEDFLGSEVASSFKKAVRQEFDSLTK